MVSTSASGGVPSDPLAKAKLLFLEDNATYSCLGFLKIKYETKRIYKC